MSERVICEKATDDYGHDYGVPDPNSPSITEVVEVLEEIRPYAMLMTVDPDVIKRIDNLIARLEDV